MTEGIRIEWYASNAGPSAMEAIFAGSLGLAYVGPNPAINAHARSAGDEIRIIAGAMNGGSALVVQGDADLAEAADFRGKRIATPQFGNTQDVAARAWVSRLELEADGKVLVDDKDAVTTVLAARATFLAEHEDLVRQFAAAHRGLTEWIVGHPAETQQMVMDELRLQFRITLAPEVLSRAWNRMTPTSEVSLESLQAFVESAHAVGFLRTVPDLSRLLAIPP